MLRHRFLATLFAFLTLLPLCANAHEGHPRIRAVASFSILGDLVRQIGGDTVDVTVLVGPDADAHTWQPTPAQAVEIANAEVIFEIGLGFEPWLQGLVEASATKARRVVVSRHLTPIHDGDGPAAHPDPHVWQDVRHVWIIAVEIRDTLAALNPRGAAAIRARADKFLAELDTLDADIQRRMEAIPAARRKIVTSHDALGYFARRYRVPVHTSALGSLTTETGDPSPARLARVVEEIRREKVPAIFAENVHDSRVMQQIAREAGVVLAPALYTDALGASGSPAPTYIEMMRHNIATIEKALVAR